MITRNIGQSYKRSTIVNYDARCRSLWLNNEDSRVLSCDCKTFVRLDTDSNLVLASQIWIPSSPALLFCKVEMEDAEDRLKAATEINALMFFCMYKCVGVFCLVLLFSINLYGEIRSSC